MGKDERCNEPVKSLASLVSLTDEAGSRYQTTGSGLSWARPPASRLLIGLREADFQPEALSFGPARLTPL
jgi:hypothetical protein